MKMQCQAKSKKIITYAGRNGISPFLVWKGCRIRRGGHFGHHKSFLLMKRLLAITAFVILLVAQSDV